MKNEKVVYVVPKGTLCTISFPIGRFAEEIEANTERDIMIEEKWLAHYKNAYKDEFLFSENGSIANDEEWADAILFIIDTKYFIKL